MNATRSQLARWASNQIDPTQDSPRELLDAFTPRELRDAFTLSELRDAFTLRELRDAFTLSELLGAFTLRELRDAFTLRELRAAFTLRELRAAFTLRELCDAFTPRELLGAFTLRELRDAFSPSELRAIENAPVIEKPYTRMLADIRAGQRVHSQITFGPDCDPATNLCKTPMCTAGHLVNMAGAAGYALKEQFGWAGAAAILHDKAHPGWPCQNFGNIPQAWAMAYIEEMAEREAKEVAP